MNINNVQISLWPLVAGLTIIIFIILIFSACKIIVNENENGDILISKVLLQLIISSISLAVGIYCLSRAMNLGFENNLTAYIAIIGGIPTIYLWIVRERKKEKDQEIALSSLNKKDIEIYQNKIAELNKVYVDAITQFYNSESFMAGAYALNALVDDWLVLTKEHPSNSEEHLIRFSQISSILFSKRTEITDNHQFNLLIEQLFIKVAKTSVMYKHFKFNWEGYSFDNLNFSGADLNGADLSYAKLNGAILIMADLSSVELTGAKLNHADLSYADLSRANLRDAELNHAFISNSSFSNAKLNNSSLREMRIDIESHLYSLIGDYAYNFSMTNCDLTNADLTNTDLTYANLKGATFSDTIISYNQLFEINQITLNQIQGLLIYDDESKDNEPTTEIIIEKLQSKIQEIDSPISKTILKALLLK